MRPVTTLQGGGAMSMTLNLVERLASQGRKYQQLGLEQEAAQCWTRLSGLAGLPAELAREAQSCLGEFHLQRRRYTRARRHLSAALAQQPGNAHFHYLLGSAFEADGKGDSARALTYYRRAIQISPEEPQYLCAFGLLALEMGDDDEEGIAALRHALELAPDDAEIMEQVVEGIEQTDREEARRILRSAMFRHPRDARFQKLWSDFHFRCLHADQKRERHDYPEQTGPVLLPFVRPDGDVAHVRRDAPSRPGRPHFHMQRSGKKHA
jgi:tetratricopeptide (TPR) repeat protein